MAPGIKIYISGRLEKFQGRTPFFNRIAELGSDRIPHVRH